MTVSKVERDKLRFTGWDIERYEDKIKVAIQNYVNSLKEITEIRKADRHDRLTKLEMKEHRKFTGKLSRLAQGTRPDLSYMVLPMFRKKNIATIMDSH